MNRRLAEVSSEASGEAWPPCSAVTMSLNVAVTSIDIDHLSFGTLIRCSSGNAPGRIAQSVGRLMSMERTRAKTKHARNPDPPKSRKKSEGRLDHHVCIVNWVPFNLDPMGRVCRVCANRGSFQPDIFLRPL